MRIAEQMKIYGYLRPSEWKILESVSLIEVKSVSSYTLARIRLYSGFHLCTNIYVFFFFLLIQIEDIPLQQFPECILCSVE